MWIPMSGTSEKVGTRICDECRQVITLGVPQPIDPVLLTPHQPIDFCGAACETRFNKSGGNVKRNKALRSGV